MIGRLPAPTAGAQGIELGWSGDLRRHFLAAALTAGGATHLVVGIQHGMTSFALLSLAAGALQLGLAALALESSSPIPRRIALVLALGLIALWGINVTTGLPPLIAHSHMPGTHRLGGLTLAWPGPIDVQGVVAKIAETCTAVGALLLERATRSKRERASS
jgi:hypothetical protein